MPDTLASMPMLEATAWNVAELAEGIHDLLAHDPPALDRRQILGMLAHLSRTRERLEKVAAWLADAGPAVVVDEEEQHADAGV